MTPRLSLFVSPPPCVPVAVSPATGHGFSASKFSDHWHANSTANSFPYHSGNFSNIGASISYQANQALRSAQRNAQRITFFDARSTRNGYSLPQVNLSQTSAAMFAPYFVKISYLHRP